MKRLMVRILCAFFLAILTATVTQFREVQIAGLQQMRRQWLNANSSLFANSSDPTLQFHIQNTTSNIEDITQTNLCPVESPLLQGNNHVRFDGEYLIQCFMNQEPR